MFRRTVSLLVLLTGVSVLNAQEVTKLVAAPAKTDPIIKIPTLDEKIALALRNHPDIKAAEAKRALAEAELEQAKLALSQKIAVASAKVSSAKEELMVARELMDLTARLGQSGTLSKTEELVIRKNFVLATSNLTLAETELKNLLTMPKAEVTMTFETAGWVYELPVKSVEGNKAESIAPESLTKLREALSVQVSLDLKNPTITKVQEWLGQMAEGKYVFRFQGIELIEKLKTVPQLGVLKGRMTMGASYQLIIDELNAVVTDENVVQQPYQVYVRDYGILICPARSAPKDAMTLAQFMKREKGK